MIQTLSKFKEITILVCIGATIAIVASFCIKPSSEMRVRELISPPPYLSYFTFGHREVIADSLWVRAIQDYDYCESKDIKNNCKGNGWLYKMLDTITDLSPHFRMPYATGGLALTVIVSDIEGASKFYDKAVLAFPNDWRILYQASYQALYEEHNNVKAAGLLERTAKNGGQAWMYSLAARLYSEGGEKEVGLRLYESLKSDPNTDPAILKRMAKKLGIPD